MVAAKRAFSLMELLVVISIIAVLAGILMPAIGMVRDRARGISCSSNQRQVMMAVLGYVGEHDDFLPFSLCEGQAPSEYGLPAGDNDASWINTASCGQYLDIILNRSWIGYAKGNIKALHCRTDRESIGIDNGTTSYGLNYLYCPNTKAAWTSWPMGIFSPSGLPGFAPIAAVPHKSGAAIVSDAAGDTRWAPGNGLPPTCAAYAKPGTPSNWVTAGMSPAAQVPRHARGTNIAFLDGHAAWSPNLGVEALAGTIYASPKSP